MTNSNDPTRKTGLSTNNDADRPAARLKPQLVALLGEKRYDAALELLYQARASAPGDQELAASIARIKEFLVGSYARKLGGLDCVAGPIPVESARSPDALMVAKYVDGVTTFGDIARMCPLGQLQTLAVLVTMYGVDSSAQKVASKPQETVATRAPDESQKIVVGEVLARLGVDEQRDAPTAEVLPPKPIEPVPTPSAPMPIVRVPAPPEPSPTRVFRAVTPPVATTVTPRFELPKARESEQEKAFRESFASGSALFVQRRYAEAKQAFETCLKLRPDDSTSQAMLRRIERETRV